MMKLYEISPLVGFNNVKFGMSRAEVHNSLGTPVKEFKKSKFSKTLSDDYSEFYIYYDAADRCEAVEFVGDVEVSLDRHIIYPSNKSSVQKLNYEFTEEPDGLISTNYSIGVYAPDDDVESVLFGAKDYYL